MSQLPPSAGEPNSSSSSRELAQPPVFVALDLGTNNCRLLIARPAPEARAHGGGIKVMDTFSRIVRLGEGLSANGNILSPEAIGRTIAALKLCKRKMDRFNVTAARFVATEACRQAKNSAEFLAQVENEVGIKIDVISNEEEAKLAFWGCSPLLAPQSEYAIVFDIGGGSTEFMWVKREENDSALWRTHHILDWLSLNQGVMNLSEKFGGAAYAEMYFDELVGHLAGRLREFDKKNQISQTIKKNKVQMLSTSGTLTTLAAMHLKLTHYERARVDGFSFSTSELRDAVQKILAMRPAERFANACIGSDRSDYIISGCAIFEAICTLWGVEEITIADRGVREGILISLMQQHERASRT